MKVLLLVFMFPGLIHASYSSLSPQVSFGKFINENDLKIVFDDVLRGNSDNHDFLVAGYAKLYSYTLAELLRWKLEPVKCVHYVDYSTKDTGKTHGFLGLNKVTAFEVIVQVACPKTVQIDISIMNSSRNSGVFNPDKVVSIGYGDYAKAHLKITSRDSEEVGYYGLESSYEGTNSDGTFELSSEKVEAWFKN